MTHLLPAPQPRATSQRDDTELSVLMEKLEAENREVDGDDDGED